MNTRLALGALSALTLAVLTACGGGSGPEGPAAPSSTDTTRVIAFGDSLTDGGAYSRGNSLVLQTQVGIPKAVADVVGKFTNSTVGASNDIWVEALAKKLGKSIAPERFEVGAANPTAATNGTNTAANAHNYAQGGSRVAKVPGVGCNPNPAGACTAQAAVPVVTQIDRALAKGGLGASDLVFIWAGANDVFFNAGLAGAEVTAASTAARRALTDDETRAIVGKYVVEMEVAALTVLAQASRLKAAGAERVVLMTIPNSAASPYGATGGPAAQGLLTTLTDAYNNQLKRELQLQNPGGVMLFDAGALSAAWYSAPTANGFANVQAPVCDVPAALGNSSSFCFIAGAQPGPTNPFLRALPAGVTAENSMFADGVHPSLAAHAKFSTALYDALKAKGWVK